MRENRPSTTAAGIAITRAIESLKPEGERICYDPLARRFVGPVLYYLTKFFVDIGYAERRSPGVMGFLAVRERYIDDYLRSCLQERLEQLVILGAGYDSRAYRFEQLMGQVKVYEVDHPATQQAKKAKLVEIFGTLPQHVVYVPVDFVRETLEERLSENGYDQRLKTLFIWQGVTQYLTPEAVNSTLAFVAHHASKGSAIIFDYMYSAALEGAMRRAEVSSMRRYRRFTGEALSFGIPEGTIKQFLQERGFTRVKNASAEELHRLYFTGGNQKRRVAAGYAIAWAVV